MPSISFLTATSKSQTSKEDRLCCDVARMPHYVTVPLQRAEHAPRIPTSPIPAMSLTVLKEYVEEWADNAFGHCRSIIASGLIARRRELFGFFTTALSRGVPVL